VNIDGSSDARRFDRHAIIDAVEAFLAAST